MKRILISLSIIGAVAAIVIGATGAFFSDVETSTGNTLTAGTIDLAVNNENPLDGAVVTLRDVKPSEAIEDVEVVLSNVGTNDGIADLHIGVGESDEGIDSEPECVEEEKDWDGTQCVGEEVLDENICEMIIYDYCYDANDNGECDETDPQDVITPSQGVDLGRLLAGESRSLWLSHHLDGSAGNEYQGDTCTWNIDFTLKQIIPE